MVYYLVFVFGIVIFAFLLSRGKGGSHWNLHSVRSISYLTSHVVHARYIEKL